MPRRADFYMSSAAFMAFLENLSITNREDISTTYRRITARLNSDFRAIESDTLYSLQVGSFGRRTAINGISDLDMVYEMPPDDYQRFNAYDGNGQSAILQAIRLSLLKTYNKTLISGDGPVVIVPLKHHQFEVLPAFNNGDGTYTYGETGDGGTWALTKPRQERDAFDSFDKECVGNLRNVAKMLRAWKSTCGAPVGGWLLDTLVYRFFEKHPQWKTATLDDYAILLIAIFEYLEGQDNDGVWYAPGSNDPVTAKGPFTPRAKKALTKLKDALEEQTLLEKCRKWRSVFGRQFELLDEVYKNDLRRVAARVGQHERFIEDEFPINICYDLKIDYEVTEEKVTLWEFMKIPRSHRRLPIGRGLRFYIATCTVPEPYDVYWKVRNRGSNAKGKERGEIMMDAGRRQKIERTAFSGRHYVEGYVIKDGMCVARDRAEVPIVDV